MLRRDIKELVKTANDTCIARIEKNWKFVQNKH